MAEIDEGYDARFVIGQCQSVKERVTTDVTDTGFVADQRETIFL